MMNHRWLASGPDALQILASILIRRRISAPSAIITIVFGEADPPLAATLQATSLRQGFGVAGTRATTAVEAAPKAFGAATFKILQAGAPAAAEVGAIDLNRRRAVRVNRPYLFLSAAIRPHHEPDHALWSSTTTAGCAASPAIN